MRAALLVLVLAGCFDGAQATPDAATDAAIRVACDGALCKTANGGSCNASAGDPSVLVLVAFALRRRGARR